MEQGPQQETLPINPETGQPMTEVEVDIMRKYLEELPPHQLDMTLVAMETLGDEVKEMTPKQIEAKFRGGKYEGFNKNDVEQSIALTIRLIDELKNKVEKE